jgi:hypothetical protein
MSSLRPTEEQPSEGRSWALAEKILTNGKFTPILVDRARGALWVLDGHHRLEAVETMRALGLLGDYVWVQERVRR